MTGPGKTGKNWLCPLVVLGACAAGGVVQGQPNAQSGSGTWLELSDQQEDTPETRVGPQAQTAEPRANPLPEVKPDRRPTAYTPPAGAPRQNPGRGVFGVDPRNYVVPNPLRDGRANERRPTGTPSGLGESKTPPLFGPDGQPSPAPQSWTPNDSTSAVRTGTKANERTRTARSSTSPTSKTGHGPEQAARVEQPKPQSWWNKLNPFRKGSKPARGETTAAAPRASFAPASADATRHAFQGLSQQPPATPTSRQATTEWAFGKRFSSVPTTPTASRTEPDAEGRQ